MVRKLCTTSFFVALLVPAGAVAATPVFPGVSYSRVLRFTPRGPVSLHVIKGPRPTGLYSLQPVLSNGTVLGRQTVSSIQRDTAGQVSSIGVNGDFFNWLEGYPSGILMRNGVLDHQPHPRRSSLGIDSVGTLHVDRVALSATWRGAGRAHPLQRLNDPGGTDGATLYTPAWGAATPADTGSWETILANVPATVPGAPLTGRIVSQKLAGGTPIPAGGAVLVARGRAVDAVLAETAVGESVTLTLGLTPWAGMVGALGGGPLLVRDGRGAVDLGEQLTYGQLRAREPRTAVGQRADGGIVILAADGRQRSSAGITNFELATELVRLGCVTGMSLDSGGSTTVALEGKVLNRPSDRSGERPVAEALLLTYSGIYAPLPTAPVVSPNGDGVGERQRLAYKLVRPSTVTARLVAPDGTELPVDAAARAPGRYSFAWEGRDAREGLWRWRVTAVDDLGRTTAAERTFRLDRTLGFVSTAARRRRVAVRFALARPAQVRVAVVSRFGETLRRLRPRTLPAGKAAISFVARDGRGRRLRGAYELRVSATSEVGTSDLAVPLHLRG